LFLKGAIAKKKIVVSPIKRPIHGNTLGAKSPVERAASTKPVEKIKKIKKSKKC